MKPWKKLRMLLKWLNILFCDVYHISLSVFQCKMKSRMRRRLKSLCNAEGRIVWGLNQSMEKNKTSSMALITCLTLIVVLSFGVQAFADMSVISQESINVLSKVNRAKAEIAAVVKPAVVSISATKTIRSKKAASSFVNDPHFRRFSGYGSGPNAEPRQCSQPNLGSGVIVDANGYILTNNHVIKNADDIKIKLDDMREFNGKVIGTDPESDLAVIKVDATHLPFLKWGDSDKLEVGATVLAVGDPYGLNQTVTSGIVCATGRANVGITEYEDFIQTDAPINPGNSGGPLVNVRGELVGINTAIFSTTGGYQGIGFAIPTRVARVVMKELINNGKVTRGWLGVSVQAVTPELAKLFGLKDQKGALVGDIVEKGPVEKAGIQRGDIILQYDGRNVIDPSSLRNMVADTPPNKEVAIQLLRSGKPVIVKAVTVEMPVEIETPLEQSSGTPSSVFSGEKVQGITPELRKELNVPERINGVIVTNIEDGSAADKSLLDKDIILEINSKKIKNISDYEAVISEIQPGQDVLLMVYRNKSTLFVALTPI